MSDRAENRRPTHLIVVLLGLALTACVGTKPAPSTEPVVEPAPPAEIAAVPEKPRTEQLEANSAQAAPVPAPTAAPAPATAPARSAAAAVVTPPVEVREQATSKPPVETAPRTTTERTASAAPAPAAKSVVPPTSTKSASLPVPPRPAVVAPSAPAPAQKTPPKVAAAPVAPRAPAAPLDLDSLETRLRQTKAIGVMTKLSLKNQVDDLLEKARAYHQRKGSTQLADLRRNYDMLLLKVLSLLQDSDPPLANDIVKSRAAIWNILEDPRKFAEFTQVAGATR